MSKDRKACCVYYVSKGVCSISNKECTINGEMQHCPMYEPAAKGKPIKVDRRNQRRDKERRRRDDWD